MKFSGILRQSRVMVVLVSVVLGFLLAQQLRGDVKLTERLEQESEEDLIRILDSLTSEADLLQDEIDRLRTELRELEVSSQQESAAVDSAEEQLRSLQVLAATTAVRGPGVEVVIDDGSRQVSYDVMIDVVQELRDAGAEAIAVNGRRVGVASYFATDGTAISLDGARLEPPYRVAAIGDAATLEGGLEIRGGAVDSVEALPGVRVRVERHSNLRLPPVDNPPEFDSARPVGSEP